MELSGCGCLCSFKKSLVVKKLVRVYRRKRLEAILKLEDSFILLLKDTVNRAHILIHVLITSFCYHVECHIIAIPNRHRASKVFIAVDLMEVKLPRRRRHGDSRLSGSILSVL